MRGVLFFISLGLLGTSCEDVVEIELPQAETRLIVDAITRIDIDEELIPFEVKVTTTNNFFEEIPVTSLERVIISVEVLDEFGVYISSVKTLAESAPGTGIYVPDPCCESNLTQTSVLEGDVIFTLILDHQGRRYYAQTRYVETGPIENIDKGDNTLFGEDDTEIVISFNDEPDKENFYLFDLDYGNYFLTDDRFYPGQNFEFSYFYDRTFEPGTQLNIGILGVNENFSNYMAQLLEQSEEPQTPFQSPATTVRGNVFDITGLDNIEIFDNVGRPDDFALGYFAVVQEHKTSLIIE